MARAINSHHVDAVEDLLHGEGPHAHASDLLTDIGGALAGRLGGGGLGLRGLGLDAFAPRIGTDGPDTIFGGEGTDVINARGSDDVASGFGGDDVVLGGDGDDVLTGDSSFVPGGPTFPTQTAGDDTVFGGDGDDTINGDDFRASAFGTTSNLLFGGAGDDAITAGFGADTVSGGSGDDSIRGYGSTSGLGGSAGAGAIERDLGDLLSGGAGNDTIEAGGGDDTVHGGAGDDTILGDVGIDAMTGGAGADRFVFRSAPVFATSDTGQGEGNRDVITDFETGADLLDFTGYLRGDLDVRWEYDAAADRTIVTYEDPRGAAFFPDLQIELTGVRDLSESDFVFRAPTNTDALA